MVTCLSQTGKTAPEKVTCLPKTSQWPLASDSSPPPESSWDSRLCCVHHLSATLSRQAGGWQWIPQDAVHWAGNEMDLHLAVLRASRAPYTALVGGLSAKSE